MVEAGMDREGRGWRSGWRGAAEDAWRLIGVGVLLVGVFLLFMRLRVVVLPLFAGALLATLVAPFADWQRRRGVPSALAALVAVFGVVLAVLALTVGAVSYALTDAEELSTKVGDSADELADWLVDGPANLDRADVEEARENLGEEAGEAARRWARGGGLAKSTTTALEVLAGAVLAVLVGFFLVKDNERLASSALGLWRPDRRSRVRATARAGIDGLRGYLKGCLLLGVVEAVIIGGAVAVLASPTLGVPIAVLTLLAAFVPIVGAIVAGVLAVAVTLAEGGLVAAVAVAVIAVVVQQLDNDVLAPFIFSKHTELHPLVILVAVTAGGALAGLAGAFVAVPMTAAVTAMVGAWRSSPDDDPQPEPAEPAEPAVA
ncbi:MAG TPA: AI-2E family transporter [Acidimicrobiales bacterium]